MSDPLPYNKPLKEWSGCDLERGIIRGHFDAMQTREVERILRERETEPDRNLQR